MEIWDEEEDGTPATHGGGGRWGTGGVLQSSLQALQVGSAMSLGGQPRRCHSSFGAVSAAGGRGVLDGALGGQTGGWEKEVWKGS